MKSLTKELGQVPLNQISSELATLWQLCADQDNNVPITRSLTMNLIAVTDAEGENRLRNARERMLARHPCRACAIVLDPDRKEVTAELGAEAAVGENSRQIVLERIVLRASPHDLIKIPGIIRPLLVSDLPVHQFWAMALPQDLGQLNLLGSMADRTIVDASLFEHPVDDLRRVASLESPRLLDLAWFRLRPWRRGLAEAFEHFDWHAAQLTTVAIHYGKGTGAFAASLKLADWMNRRLKAESKLLADGDEGTVGEPSHVEVKQGQKTIVIQRLADQHRLQVEVSLEDRCLLPFEVVASRGQPGDLLAAAVDVA